jgi:hypothetical protein
MHDRIKFHAYSDIKVYTETVSREKEILSEIYAESWKRRLQTSQAIDWLQTSQAIDIEVKLIFVPKSLIDT